MIQEREDRRDRGILLCCAALLVALGILPVRAQELAPADSARADTVLVAVPDTVRAVAPASLDPMRPAFPGSTPFGSVVYSPQSSQYKLVSELDLAWQRYATAFDVFAPHLHALPLSLGAPGLTRALSVAGSSPRAISWLTNGRPLDGPTAMGYDAELYPMEFLERAEVLTGARALLYGTGEALATVNLPQPRFDVEASYSRLWYIQDAGDFTGLDVMFSRNAGRRANVSLGVRRLSGGDDQSVRFDNQAVDDWTIHGSVTWRPGRAWMIGFTDLYSDGTRGQNGGLLLESTIDPLNEIVVEPLRGERRIQHEMTLAAEWADPKGWTDMRDSLVRFSGADSAARVGASIYYSVSRRQIESADTIVRPGGIEIREDRDALGARGFARLPLGAILVEVNALAEMQSRSTWRSGDVDAARRQAGAAITVPLGPLVFVGSGRFGEGPDGTISAAAADLWLGQTEEIGARAGARLMDYSCPCGTVQLGDSIPFDAWRTTMLVQADAWWRSERHAIEALGALRRAELVELGGGVQDFATVELRGRTSFWILALEARVIGVFPPEGDERFARWRGTGDLYSPLRLFEGNLDLRIGTTVDVHSDVSGAQFDAYTNSFFTWSGAGLIPRRHFPLWSVWAHARFGSSYVRAMVRNLLDVETWSVFRYPEPGRSFVLEVTWSFVD